MLSLGFFGRANARLALCCSSLASFAIAAALTATSASAQNVPDPNTQFQLDTRRESIDFSFAAAAKDAVAGERLPETAYKLCPWNKRKPKDEPKTKTFAKPDPKFFDASPKNSCIGDDGRLYVTHYEQPTTWKLTAPFNPSYESNALKSNAVANSDINYSFGGTGQVVVGGHGVYDLLGVSIQSQSVRYDKFVTKSSDAITTQAFYQFFLGGSFDKNGEVKNVVVPYRGVR